MPCCSIDAAAGAASELAGADASEATPDPAAGSGEACMLTPRQVGGGGSGENFRLPTAGSLDVDGDKPLVLAGS